MEGGILELQMRELDVECLPGDIPESIDVDVSGLNIGDHVTVGDLVYDKDKLKIFVDASQIVAGVLAPRIEEVVAPVAPAEGEAAEAAPGAEPEMIKKGKAEEE